VAVSRLNEGEGYFQWKRAKFEVISAVAQKFWGLLLIFIPVIMIIKLPA
jgi:hypothetical protein